MDIDTPTHSCAKRDREEERASLARTTNAMLARILFVFSAAYALMSGLAIAGALGGLQWWTSFWSAYQPPDSLITGWGAIAKDIPGWLAWFLFFSVSTFFAGAGMKRLTLLPRIGRIFYVLFATAILVDTLGWFYAELTGSAYGLPWLNAIVFALSIGCMSIAFRKPSAPARFASVDFDEEDLEL